MKDTLSTLWRAFGMYRWHVVVLAVFGFLSAILEGIGINAVIPLISFFTGGANTSTDFISQTIQALFAFLHIPFSFRYLLGFILALFIARSVAVIAFGYIRGWIVADFLGKETEDLLGRMMRASWPYMLSQKLGTMHNNLVRDIQCTSNLLSVATQAIQSWSGFLMYLLVAVNISPVMTLYAVGGGGALLFVVRPLLERMRRLGDTVSLTEKQFSQFLSEHIIGMKSVKASGAVEPALAEGASQIRRLRALSIRQTLTRALSTSFFQPASLALVIALFLLTYRSPDFNIIAFAAALYLIQKIFTYLESGQNALVSVNEMLPYAENVANVKRVLAENRESAKAAAKPFRFESSLAFERVCFAYNSSEPTLEDMSFSIERGQTVGLVGPSGAGKTSIADIILRLFRPAQGRVLLDGVDAEDIPLADWRKHIGYVSQDVFLFNGTIEENIRFYRPELSREEIVAAAKQANIYDFIMGLPEGFKTITGDRGVMLSGGQRQRIALARALAGNPSLLILDEATSALDHESEKLIHESIRALHGRITVLIIAHRPSTVAEADAILVLHHGRIIERGTPQELLQNHESYFSKMQRV
ncbi:ABC transporter ATP-binding protein [Candidatus Kaiserbacteria bacterium]|nr:ABC transporter ATP-binding protein [Candidatus Kaiserbacteria bacterium]